MENVAPRGGGWPLSGLVQARRRQSGLPALVRPPRSRSGQVFSSTSCNAGVEQVQVHVPVYVQVLVHVQVPELPLLPSPRGSSRGE